MPERQGERRAYRVVKFALQRDSSGNIITRPQEFKGLGTHLFLAELTGSDTINVRLDVEGAGWLAMEEGDTVTREFTTFWVRSNARFNGDDSFNTLGGAVSAIFYVSDGPLLFKAPKKYGLRSGFLTVGGLATSVGVDAFGGFATQYAALFPKGDVDFFRYGGTLIVRNRDAASSLFLYMGTVGSFAAGGGVYPDETTSLEVPPLTTMAFQVENRLSNIRHPDGANRLTTLVAAKIGAGTVAFTVTCSRFGFDFTDPECIPPGSGLASLDL